MTIPTKLNENAKTEFGRGLITCLLKFAEHAEGWFRLKNEYTTMREGYAGEHMPSFLDESRAVEMFFNGASDHLYEIQVPKRWEGTEIDTKVRELQGLALHAGHGFDPTRKWGEEDIIHAYDLCREIALLIDRKVGLKPDIGRW